MHVNKKNKKKDRFPSVEAAYLSLRLLPARDPHGMSLSVVNELIRVVRLDLEWSVLYR
jgi:hypothetical protein